MFEGKKRIDLDLPTEDGQSWTIEKLIDELRRRHLREKEEMFV